MLTVVRADSLVGVMGRERFAVEWRPGMTVADAMRGTESAEWPLGLRLECFANGTRVSQKSPIQDGTHLVYGPSVGGLDPFTGFALFVVGQFLSFAVSKLSRKQVDEPEPVEVAEESSTFGWNGAETTIGDGYYTPICVGTLRLPGHIISMDIEPDGNTERIRVLVELGWGPFHAIGGIARDSEFAIGQVNTPRFDTLEVNGIALTADVQDSLLDQAAVRMGTHNQAPMPPWLSRMSAVVDVRFDLLQFDDAVTIVIPDTKARRARVQIDFPRGLFRQDAQGNYVSQFVEFGISTRARSSSAFGAQVFWQHTENSRDPFSRTLQLDLPVPAGAPTGFDGFEIRVRRSSALVPSTLPPGEFRQTAAVVSRVTYSALEAQSLPGVALLGLSMRANTQFTGGTPQISVVCDTSLVRLYDEGIGLSEPIYYDFPGSGDPYEGIWVNVRPGDNPAWQAVHLLESEHAGEPLRVQPVYALFRDWADYCDAQGLRSAYQFDRPGPILDQLNSTVFQAGRAIMVRSGREVFPVYWFRDAHGRGTNFVPAKGPMAVVCGSNCESWQVTLVANHQRPNKVSAQILSEEENYTLVTESVNDPSVNTTNPLRRDFVPVREEEVRLSAVTSPTQARDHLWWTMKRQQLGDRELEVVVPVELVYFRVGDNFLFQADKYLALSDDENEDARFSSRLFEDASSGTSTVKFKKPLILPQAGYYGCAIFSGTRVIKRTIDATAQTTFAIGEAIPLTDTLPFNVAAGQNIVVGLWSAVDPGATPLVAAEEYEATDFQLLDGFKVRILATKWAPEAYDPAPAGALVTVKGGPAPPPAAAGGTADQTDPEVVDVSGVSLVRTAAGEYRLSWIMPPGYQGRRAGVSVRAKGAAGWRELGETSAMTIVADALPFDRTGQMEVRIAPFITELGIVSPTTRLLELHVPEFEERAVATPARVVASVTADGVTLSWDEVPSADFYEVRRGGVWDGAEVVGIVEGRELELRSLARGTRAYLVKARRRAGGWSPTAAVTTVEWEQNGDSIEFASVDDAGDQLTRIGMDKITADGEAVLKPERLTAHCKIALDYGTPLVALWTCEVDYYESMPGLTVDHPLSRVPILSGEGHFRGSLTREPSARFPGVDLELLVEDLDDGTEPMSVNTRGGVGRNTLVRLQVKWDLNGTGTFTAWEPFRPQRKRAAGAEFRAVCRRRSTDYQIHVTRMRAQMQS